MTILTDAELETLTTFFRSDAQRRELDHLGIPYRVRRDGSLLVLWADVELRAGGRSIEPKEPEMHL